MQTHAVNKVAEKSFVMQEREKSDLKVYLCFICENQNTEITFVTFVNKTTYILLKLYLVCKIIVKYITLDIWNIINFTLHKNTYSVKTVYFNFKCCNINIITKFTFNKV